MKEAVDDIMVTLNEAASEVGLVGGMVDAIAEAMSKVGMTLSLLFTPCLHCSLATQSLSYLVPKSCSLRS
jgi:hypothetical protein